MSKEAASFTLPHKTEPGNAVVYMYRSMGGGAMWTFDTYLDGKDDNSKMGGTYIGQYIYFYINPGKHKIYTKAPDNWDEITIDANAGEIIYLRQNTSLIGFISRVKLERLSNTEGKYRIKDCEQGTIIKNRKL